MHVATFTLYCRTPPSNYLHSFDDYTNSCYYRPCFRACINFYDVSKELRIAILLQLILFIPYEG
jgi:hypothetical protein